MNGILMMESLVQVPWSVAGRTYGNPDSSLTGLIVNWWIGLAPKHNQVLEGGLAFTQGKSESKTPNKATKKKGAAAGPACDLVLCLRGEPIGLVEIESAKPVAALDCLEQMLSSGLPELQSLRFVMAVLHAYQPAGKGEERCIPKTCGPEVLARTSALSVRFPDKNVVLLRLDKRYEPQDTGVRALNELYWGTLEDVEGTLYREGEEQMRRPYDLSTLHVGDSVLI